MSTPRRSPLVWLLLGLLTLELLLIAGLTIVLLVELIVDRPDSMATALALAVLALLATAWLAATVVGALRGQAWTRGSALVWQVLQFAVGIGAIQGAFAQPAWGWPLIAVSLGTFALLFAPSVVAATSDRIRRAD